LSGRWHADTALAQQTAFPDDPFEAIVDRMRRLHAILNERRQRGAIATA
jgi:hypothetical protein